MKEELSNFGLSTKQIEIYLAALALGTCTAKELSVKTGFSRSSIYDILVPLKQQGLINELIERKVKHFQASDPSSLLVDLKQKQTSIQNILPELVQLQKSPDLIMNVFVYRGKLSMRTAANKMLDSKEILVYGGSTKADDVFGVYTANFAAKRAEKKIILKTICGSQVPSHMVTKKNKIYTPLRTLPELDDHTTSYFIFNDTVLIWSYGVDLIATEIQSSSVAESQRVLFDVLWNRAKPVK